MPSISAGSKVLVTGASGFLASHVCDNLLKRGYSVRGTVRSQPKGDYLRNLFGPMHGNKFEYVIVEDMGTPGAFEKSIKEVEAIVHTAALLGRTMPEDPAEVVKTVVDGAVDMLECVKASGQGVKRITFTSSIAAVIPGAMEESSFNDAAVDAIREKGLKSTPHEKYAASKVLTERANLDFVEKNKGQISFDVTNLPAPWIFGPMIHQGGPVSSSVKFLLSCLDPTKPKSGDDLLKEPMKTYSDVRDIANIYVDVLEKEDGGNDRFFTVAGRFVWQDVYDALNEAPAFSGILRGDPDASKAYPPLISQKLFQLLGKTRDELYRPWNVTVRESYESALARGFTTNIYEEE